MTKKKKYSCMFALIYHDVRGQKRVEGVWQIMLIKGGEDAITVVLCHTPVKDKIR